MEAMIPMLYLFYYELGSSRREDVDWEKDGLHGSGPRRASGASFAHSLLYLLGM